MSNDFSLPTPMQGHTPEQMFPTTMAHAASLIDRAEKSGAFWVFVATTPEHSVLCGALWQRFYRQFNQPGECIALSVPVEDDLFLASPVYVYLMVKARMSAAQYQEACAALGKGIDLRPANRPGSVSVAEAEADGMKTVILADDLITGQRATDWLRRFLSRHGDKGGRSPTFSPAAPPYAPIPSPLKWHGGKHYLAGKIVGLFPPRGSYLTYCEPFAGSLAVLLTHDPTGVSEVVNDLDGDLCAFWLACQDERAFAFLKRHLDSTPFSEWEWKAARDMLGEGGYGVAEVAQRARDFFVFCRQSLAGRMKSFAPLSKTRTRRGMNEQASAWMAAVDGLPEVHARLRRVSILHRPALEVIRQMDDPKTLFYLDPPYLPETRAAGEVYRHEMTREQHVELLEALLRVRGRFLLSGYQNPLYQGYAQKGDWVRVDFDLPNNASAGGSKRRMVESVWKNYP